MAMHVYKFKLLYLQLPPQPTSFIFRFYITVQIFSRSNILEQITENSKRSDTDRKKRINFARRKNAS